MVKRVGTYYAPGGIANEKGDLFGNSPFVIIRHGKLVIEVGRAAPAIMMGWRAVEKSKPDAEQGEAAGGDRCDPDFAWLERTPAEREAI